VSEPRRLLDDGLDPELARLLGAGKSEVPDDARLAAIAAKLGVVASIGAAGATAGGGTGAGAKLLGTAGAKMVGLKIGAAVLIASAATTTAVVMSSRHEAHAPAPVGIVVIPSARTSAPSPGSAGSAPESAIFPAPEPPVTVEPRTGPSPRATAPEAAPSPDAEVRLLERAQDAVRSRPAEALSLAEEHARRFPRGMLVQERELIAIEALMELGRRDEAKARAERFKARFPGSSHARRIDAILGD
jgi:hypothetical protein